MVAGGGKVSSAFDAMVFPVAKVENVCAEDAVEIAGFGLDGRVEFLEEELLFGRESLLSGESFRKAESKK